MDAQFDCFDGETADHFGEGEQGIAWRVLGHSILHNGALVLSMVTGLHKIIRINLRDLEYQFFLLVALLGSIYFEHVHRVFDTDLMHGVEPKYSVAYLLWIEVSIFLMIR